MIKLMTGSTLAGLLMVTILALMPLSLPGAAQERVHETKPLETPATPVADNKQGNEAVAPPPNAEKANNKATPLKPFEPTEKIGADSAVAFPVDI